MPKHKIYKYSGCWYMCCGACGFVHSTCWWFAARDLMALHVEHVHRDLLTAPRSL